MKNSVTKKIAAVLAAVITISTMASVGTTAFAAEVTGTAAVTAAAAAENISVREEAEAMGRKYLDALPACNLKGTVYSASWSKMGCFVNVGECEQANADGKAIVENLSFEVSAAFSDSIASLTELANASVGTGV